VHSESLPHPDDPRARIELFWTKPGGEGPWPVLLLIHGHQEGERPGARAYVDGGALARFAAIGVLAAAVSQPGYGKSNGPPDFCGPRSQRTVTAAVRHLRLQPFVDGKRIALFGYSRGAVVAAMAAAELPDLAGLVLGAGIYDLKETYPRLAAGIRANIDREAGTSDEAYRARSPMFHVQRIKAPTLILHGSDDDRAAASSAKTFGAALQKAGTAAEVVIFPATGHGIPPAQQRAEWEPFLRRHLSIQ
jgi:dipeptidyl aminopeptidase/acylaminoacyl peptidase